MPFTFTMPKLSPTMEEGTIAKWHKKEGEFVDAGDLLMEVATDKATVEYNALDSGFLRKVLVEEGGDARVNQAVAIFTEKADESIEGYAPKGTTAKAEEQVVEKGEETETAKPVAPEGPAKAAMGQPDFVPEAPLQNYVFEHTVEPVSGRLKASPLARKAAKDLGLDISTVKGSGPGGRIVKEDLELARPAGDFVLGKREIPAEAPGSYAEEKLSPIGKIVSQRLQQSKTFVPHFYVEQTINVESLVELRNQLSALEVKVSVNDCIVRACALALRKHPVVNSGFNSVNNTLVRFKTIDIAVAVNTPSGLITPIIRHADYKNIAEISAEVRALAQRAKEGKLAAEEYKGGSFTVSNLGMYGVTSFQAIISPPQAAILAVSGILDVPVVKNKLVVPGKVMNVVLSSDHRVIDGVAAAQFLSTLKQYLENPVSVLL